MTYDPRFSWNEEDNPGELQGEQRTPRKKTGGEGGRWRQFVPAFLAIGGLLLFAGIVWYAYSWGRSDGASEAIPIVHAPEGAEKERPENPGGMEVPYQDTLVLNPGNSEEEGESVERLLPPPEEPVERAEEPELAEASEEATSEKAVTEETSETETSQESQESEASAETDNQETAESATEPTSEENTTSADTTDSSSDTETSEPVAEETETDSQEDSGAQESTDSSQTVAGAYRIQLAAVRSNEAAEAEWERLQNRYNDLLGTLSLNVEHADLGEQGVYYRIQAGPLPDKASADRLCSDLQEQDQACLVRSPQ